MRRLLGPVVIIALALAGTAVAWRWHNVRRDDGSISLQFVPKQQDSPIVVLSWTFNRESLWKPIVHIRNRSDQALTGISPLLVISTPTSAQRINLPEVVTELDAGRTARVQLELPDQWPDGPWESYASGAVVTLAFASARFADGTRWESASPSTGTFTVSADIEVRPPAGGLIGPRPARERPDLAFRSGLSEYPLNSSLGDGTCVMSACKSGGYCEFDGCQLVP